MNFKKIIGWVLVSGGILIIIWTLYSSYNVFKGKAGLPKIFQTNPAYFSVNTAASTSTQAQIESAINDQLEKLIPSDTITKILNLSVWSLLAFIFIHGGAQVSGIGTKLLNKEQV